MYTVYGLLPISMLMMSLPVLEETDVEEDEDDWEDGAQMLLDTSESPNNLHSCSKPGAYERRQVA